MTPSLRSWSRWATLTLCLALAGCAVARPPGGGGAVVDGYCPGIGPVETGFRPSDPACAVSHPIRMTHGPVDLSQTATLDCRTAQALDSLIREVMMPASLDLLGQPLRTVQTGPGYVCRTIYNRLGARLSQHAFGKAIDIRGFVLEDGSTITLRRHWNDRGPAGRFLRVVRDAACQRFAEVLGPEYNTAHRDHFHFARGSYPICS